MDASEVVTGQVWVWRATQLDYVSNEESVLRDLKMEEHFQPELHDFYVMEISKNKIDL